MIPQSKAYWKETLEIHQEKMAANLDRLAQLTEGYKGVFASEPTAYRYVAHGVKQLAELAIQIEVDINYWNLLAHLYSIAEDNT